MPIYEYEGQQYDIADTDPALAKVKILNYLESQKEPEFVPAPVEPATGFIPSVKRGALGLQSLVADVAPAMAGRVAEKLNVPGAGEYANRQMQEAAQTQQRIQEMYPAAVPSYKDIKGVGDLLTYVTESVGELIPSMIPSILTGGVAGVAGRGAVIAAEQAAKKASMDAAQKTLLSYSGSKLTQEELVNLARQEAIKAGQEAAKKVALKYEASGAIAGSAAQNIPEVYQNVAQETGKEDLGAALLFGGFNSVLDAITPLTLLRKAKGSGITENELIGAWYKRAGKGALTGFATEGSTEAVQEMSSAAAEKFVDNNKEFFTPQNFERFINAGLKGGLGGGVASGATNVAFGQKEAVKPAAAMSPAGEGEITGVVKEAAKPIISKEEALAKVEAATKKKEVPSDNQSDITASGVSATVPGGSDAVDTARTVAGLDLDSMADIGGAPDETQAGKGKQPSSLIPEAAAPKEKLVQAAEAKQAEDAGPIDFATWAEEKGYSLSDGSLDWPAIEEQYKAEIGQAPSKSQKVITPDVIAADQKVAKAPAKVIHNKEKDTWNYDSDKELVESEGPLTAIQHKSGIAKEQGITKTYVDNNKVTFDLDNGGDVVVEFNKGRTTVRLNKPDKMMGTRPAESFYEDINNVQKDKTTFGLDKLQDFLPPKLAQAIQNTVKAINGDTREVVGADEFIKPFLKEAVDSDGYAALWGEREKSADKFKEELKQTPPTPKKEVKKEEAKKEEPKKEEPKKSIPAPKYDASKTTQDLIAAEKARRTSQKKPVEVMNQKVETGLDVEPTARRSETHKAGISLAQTYRQQQTELAKEIDTDETLSKEEKAAGKAFQNYMIVGNNNIKNALNILAADLFDGAGYNSNPYLPNIGGASAKMFYDSLNPANKKFVDDKVAFLKAQEKRLSKYGSESIEKTKKDFDEYGESITISMTGKQRKELNKANKAKIAENEAKIKEYNDNLKKLGETVKAEGEMFGGTTPTFMAHIMRGDLRSALNDIVKDTSGEFTALDKLVSKRLLSAKTLPSVQVIENDAFEFIFDERFKNGVNGAYRSGDDTIFINEESGLNSHIVLHEAVHGHTLTMIRAWENGEIVNKGVSDLNDLYKFLKDNHPELAAEYGIKEDLAEFASEVMSNRSFQDKLKQIPYKRSNVFTEFARAVLRVLGIAEGDKFNALASALISLDTMLSTGREYQESADFIGETAKYAADVKAEKETLKPELRGIESADEWIQSIPGQAPPKTKTVKEAFTSVKGAKELARLFQNERYPIKNWEDLLSLANKVTHSGDSQNNIYTQISLSTGRAEDEFLVKMYNPSNALYKAIGEYTKQRGIKEEAALKELQAVFIALHEGERRHVKYLMTVPLNADAAMQRDVIMDLVRSAEIDEDTARTLRTKLEELVANNKQEKGYGQDSEPSNFPLDEDSDYYNVAGIRPAIREETLAKYYAPNKEVIDQLRSALQDVHKATIDLNKKANYWSKPVSNIVAFYGFENYVPLKGRPGGKESKADELLNFDGTYNGRELQEATFAAEGRVSESDNPLLQTLADGVRAALRAGRGGVHTYTDANGAKIDEQYGITLAIKNAIEQKLLGGHKVATIQFKDRYKVDSVEALKNKGETTFFHYNPDGSIDIYAIHDTRLREAIRRTYRTSQPLIDAANHLTSFLGQLHTRYNVAFAPMNFVRDTLTNAFTMGAEMGPGAVGAIASKVTQGGIARAFKVAKLYRDGEFTKIEQLAKDDAYIKAMYEYIQLGGKVAYLQGIGVESQFMQMQKDLGRSKIATSKAQIDGVIDLWTNSFEFASRTAAYQVAKENYMNGPEQLSEREAQVKAAGYVKNLANFEQVGQWGRGLGAIFMFFRPSATGAVRAIEALVPLFRNIDNALANLPESVRNDPAAVAAFRKNMLDKRAAAQRMLMSLAGSGAAIYLMASMMAEDDEDGRNKVSTDDMARWSRYARFHIPGTDVVFQIPWGFGLGAFASAGAQIMAFGLGNNSLKDTFNNVKDIGFDSFLPLPISRINAFDNPAAWAMDSVTPSLFRPFFEYAMNLDGLGREIYNNRQTRSGDAYTGGDNIPELYKEAAKMLANVTNGGVDWSPNTMYFFANNYADGLTRLIHNSYNIGIVATGQKDFNPKTDTLAFDSFFGAKSNFDAREFSKFENQIKDKERKLNMFKNDPARYATYVSAHPYDQGLVDLYNKGVNGDLKKAREIANYYRTMPDLSPKERKEMLENVKEQQNLIKRHLISIFKAYDEL